MTGVTVKYRQLGVNAQANNYAFAEDCYSQWTVSPQFSTSGGKVLSRRANRPLSSKLNYSGGAKSMMANRRANKVPLSRPPLELSDEELNQDKKLGGDKSK